MCIIYVYADILRAKGENNISFDGKPCLQRARRACNWSKVVISTADTNFTTMPSSTSVPSRVHLISKALDLQSIQFGVWGTNLCARMNGHSRHVPSLRNQGAPDPEGLVPESVAIMSITSSEPELVPHIARFQRHRGVAGEASSHRGSAAPTPLAGGVDPEL